LPASNLVVLAVLATAFGVVEAATVVALRRWLDPTGLVFPAVVVPHDLLAIECSREVATLIVLAGAAHLAAPTRVTRTAAFLIAFGIWDLVYYAALRLWSGWPASLGTWDLLFLVPLPWFGPVYAPVLVSIVIVTAGLIALRHEHRRGPFRIQRAHLAAATIGGLVILASFIVPARGGMQPPARYPVEWFGGGLAIGVSAFLHAWHRNRRGLRIPGPAGASSTAGAPTNTAPARRAPPPPGVH